MVGLHEMREILVTPEVEAELVERERVAAEQRQRPTKKVGVLITLVSVALFVGGQHWMGSGDWTWIDFPATRHGGGVTTSFADGHAEVWRLVSADSRRIGAKPPWIQFESVKARDPDLTRFHAAIFDRP